MHQLKETVILPDRIRYVSRRRFARDRLPVPSHAVHVPLAGTNIAMHVSDQHGIQMIGGIWVLKL